MGKGNCRQQCFLREHYETYWCRQALFQTHQRAPGSSEGSSLPPILSLAIIQIVSFSKTQLPSI